MNNLNYPKGLMLGPYTGNIYGYQQQQNYQQKDLFQTLAKEFQYQFVKAPNEYMQSVVLYLKNFQIKIDQDYNISKPPSCYVNNSPYDYTKFYQWNNNSTHLSLVGAIQDQYEKQFKILHIPALKDYIDFVNLIQKDESFNRIKNMSLSQLFPNLQVTDYQQILNAHDQEQILRNLLSQNQEVQNLRDKVLLYVKQNEIIAGMFREMIKIGLIEENDYEIKSKIENILIKNNQLEEEKNINIQLQCRSKILSERFQDSKVNFLLEQICEKYDGISENLLESDLKEEYEDQANQYFQNRRKYQKTLVLSEKFRDMKKI